jgi:AcrR family transcriptional regulator
MPTHPLHALKPRKLPRQARSKETIAAIFEATIQVLIAEGAQRLTTTHVAERAGVSVGTLYQYFPHKAALLYAVIARYLEEVAKAVEAYCQQAVGQPLPSAAEGLVSTYLLAKGKQADAARALYRASSELEVADLVNAVFRRFQDAAARLLASVPNLRFQNMEGITFAWLAALTGATRVLFEQGATPELLERFRHQMVAMSCTFLQDAALKSNEDQPDHFRDGC